MSKNANVQEVQEYLIEAMAKFLKVRESEIDTAIAFDRYGVDSATAVELTGMLGDWLGTKFEPTLLFDHPTIDKLSLHLANVSSNGKG